MPDGSKISINPPGTVGVGVVDGGYMEISYASEIREIVISYLMSCGLPAKPMPFKGMGSASGGIAIAVATGLAANFIGHVLARSRTSWKRYRGRVEKQQLDAGLRECHVQLGDRRDDMRDAIELLRLLPDLQRHLLVRYPNRNYSFVVLSATKSVDSVQVILKDYEALDVNVREMVKVLKRIPKSRMIGLYLQDGPFRTRRVAYNVV